MAPSEEIGQFADVPLEIEAELDRKVMTVRDVLGWEPGSVVVLTRSAGENLDVYANGELIGYGEVVVIDTNMGIRITDFCGEE